MNSDNNKNHVKFKTINKRFKDCGAEKTNIVSGEIY